MPQMGRQNEAPLFSVMPKYEQSAIHRNIGFQL